MAITHRLELPKNKDDIYFIANDWHTEALNKKLFNIMCDMASELPVKRRKLIINGDFVDALHLMAKNPEYKKWESRSDGIEEFFLPNSEKEIEWANKTLDLIAETFSEVIYIFGNHDFRYSNFKAPPAYAHNFDLVAQLNLAKRNIKHILYPDWLDIGHLLTVTHGSFHGATAVKKHYESSGGKSVIFGHVHKFEVKPFNSRGDTVQCMSLPAMCNLNAEYIKNGIQDWSNGFAILNMRPSGKFNIQVHQMWDDEIHIGAKIYK